MNQPSKPPIDPVDLYDSPTMLSVRVKEHQQLDAGYGRKNFKNDAERVAFLFELYQQYSSLLPPKGKKAKRPQSRGKI